MTPLQSFALVAVGGALGSCARHAALVIARVRWPVAATHFPWATLAVNVVGAGALGLLTGLGLPADRASGWRLLLATGLLGGFTTYSGFNQETLELCAQGEVPRAAAYVTATLLLAGAAGMLGLVGGRVLRAATT